MTISLYAFLKELLETNNDQVINYIKALYENNKLERISNLIPKEKFNKFLSFVNKEFILEEKKEIKEVKIINEEIKEEKQIFIDKRKLVRINENYKKATLINQPIKDDLCMETKIYNINVNEEGFENRVYDLIKENQITIIQGNTGTGKSTLIPLLLMKHFNKIVVTQPRRLACISVCERVRELYFNQLFDKNLTNLEEKDKILTKVYETIGYKIRFKDDSSFNNKLLYCTDGILLTNYSLNYDLLIIDEVHERSLNIDLLISLYKYHNKNIKLILMSATIDLRKFFSFFNVGCIINLENELFNVDIFYLRKESEDYLLEIQNLIFNLLNKFRNHSLKNENGALFNKGLISNFVNEKLVDSLNILVFLPGKEEIYSLMNKLNYDFVYALHSEMKIEEMNLIHQNKKVKIILSTNVAETSITIKNLDVVIDSGYYNQMNYKSISELKRTKITQSMADQRKGRIGRVKDGILFRMYTKENYNSFIKYNIPEITNCNINSLILRILNMNLLINDISFLEEIKEKEINKSIDFLKEHKLIFIKENKPIISELGIKVNKLPLQIELALLLLNSSQLEMRMLVSLLSSYPFKLVGSNKKGDFLIMITKFKEWMNNKFSFLFLEKNDLSKKSFLFAKKVFFQLSSDIINYDSFDYKEIIKVLLSVYKKNICKKIENYYINIYDGTICYLHPNSLEIEGKYVIYTELIKTKKIYMKNCGEIPYELIKEYKIE